MSRKRGPRPGIDVKSEILEAARVTFSEIGYDRATFRRIGDAAGVDPSLVAYYFGNKQQLFAEAVHLPMPPDQVIEQVFRGDSAGMAFRLATFFFQGWENLATREALIGQLRMAFATGEPVPMRDFVVDTFLGRAEELVAGPDPALRLELAASHLLGVAVVRYVLGLEPLASTPVALLVEMITPQLASYLEQSP